MESKKCGRSLGRREGLSIFSSEKDWIRNGHKFNVVKFQGQVNLSALEKQFDKRLETLRYTLLDRNIDVLIL